MLSQFMILRRFKDVNGQVDRPDLAYGCEASRFKTVEGVCKTAGKTS